MGRNKEIRVKVTEEEYKKLKQRSIDMGIPVSTYMRVVSIYSTKTPIKVLQNSDTI